MSRALLLVVLCAGCAAAPRTPDSMLRELHPGEHLSGAVVGLGPPLVLNREDLVWAAAPSPDGTRVAFARLGSQSYHLAIFEREPPRQLADAAINPLEFDVESLAWSPDGQAIAVVSRDRQVRFFDVARGAWSGAVLTDEPLVSVAFHPSGRAVAVGSSQGLVTLLAFPSRRFQSEARAHAGEVRGLAFAADGRLFTGGWDRSVAVFATAEAPAPPGPVRVRFERAGEVVRLRGSVSGLGSGMFALDAHAGFPVVLTAAFAASVGLEAARLTQTVELHTPFGAIRAPLATQQSLQFKGLSLGPLDVALCDACVPPGAQGVLGPALLERLDVVFDEQRGEAVLTAKAPVEAVSTLQLTPVTRFTFEGQVNDLTVDAAGQVLGVAFSREKAQRTAQAHQAERRHQTPEADGWNRAALVDARSGQVLRTVLDHRGVVSTAAVSPDGASLASGGWDDTVRLGPLTETFGWSVRQLRFSADGRWLTVAAWTPQNPIGDHHSQPSAVVYEVIYRPP